MASVVPRRVGRYALFEPMAHGGTATVHLGRLYGSAGFARTLCVKRLHPHLAQEADFVKMLLDEARIAARVRHANVVSILDVVSDGGEAFVVMEYVPGVALSRLMRDATARGEPIPLRIAVAIMRDLLQGLHAAHETCDERGEPLGVVHRDVSPQNVLVGTDGIARVLDFGIAKARGRLATTEEGRLKGKLAYMAPEQLRADEVTPRTDVYAAGIVLWELLVGERLFAGDNEGHVLEQALLADIAPPSSERADLPAGLDDVVLRALERDPSRRYASAREMVAALDACVAAAPSFEVSAWLSSVAGVELATQAGRVRDVEESVATPEPRSPGARRWRSGVAVGAAVLVGVGIGAVWRGRSSDAVTAPPSAAVATSAPPEAVETAPEPLPASDDTLRKPATKTRATRPTFAKPLPKRNAACDPPFTRDADGVKVWKPECVLK